MTIEKLNKIKTLRKEINSISVRIAETYAEATSATSQGLKRAVIVGKDGKKESCTVLSTSIRLPGGVSDKVSKCAVEVTALKNEKSKLERRRGRLIAYIHAVPDVYIREIMIQRFIKERTWAEVALKFGGGNTEDGVRQAVKRFLSCR